MSDQDKEKELAEIRAQAKAEMNREMGLSDSEDENEKQEDPYVYMPYLISHPKGSAKEIEAALRMRGLQLRKDLNQSLKESSCLESSEQACTIICRFAIACGNVMGHSSK